MNTPLFLLRAVQIGLKMSDLDVLDLGTVLDMCTEYENDSYEYKDVANQEDFDKF